MEISQAINSLPVLTKYYLASIFITAFTLSYISPTIIYYMILDYSLVFKRFQIWRMVTNFVVVGGFSMNFVFFIYFFYLTFRLYEIQAFSTKRYAEFIMMLIYFVGIINLLNIISHYVFNFETSFSLSHQMIFALVYVDSKRNPLVPVMMFIFQIQNAYLPFAYLLLNVITGGLIMDPIMGIIAGHCYYVIKDILPIQKGWNIFVTPKRLVDYVEKKIADAERRANQGPFNSMNNQQSSDAFRNRNEGNNNTLRRVNDNTGNFRPFSGSGFTTG